MSGQTSCFFYVHWHFPFTYWWLIIFTEGRRRKNVLYTVFVCGVLSAVGMLFTETPDISNIQAAWLPLLYAGLLSCGVGYTLQIVGQKGINPVIASLIMSLESVISALAGWVILGQVLSPKEILGCVLMFVAIIITQIPIGNKKTD